MDANLVRMASAFQERSKQLVFLINNYDLILSVHLVSQFEGIKGFRPVIPFKIQAIRIVLIGMF